MAPNLLQAPTAAPVGFQEVPSLHREQGCLSWGSAIAEGMLRGQSQTQGPSSGNEAKTISLSNLSRIFPEYQRYCTQNRGLERYPEQESPQLLRSRSPGSCVSREGLCSILRFPQHLLLVQSGPEIPLPRLRVGLILSGARAPRAGRGLEMPKCRAGPAPEGCGGAGGSGRARHHLPAAPGPAATPARVGSRLWGPRGPG